MSATRALEPAAVEALAAYLATTLGAGVTVIRGWPEGDADLDLTIPVLSVQAVPGGSEIVGAPATDGDVVAGVVGIRQSRLTIPVQVDLWAAYREVLDATRLLVDAAMVNDLPWRPHLYLEATDHDDRPFVVYRVNDAPEIDGETAQRGEWRHIWTLRIEIERVASVTMAAATEINTSSADELTVT